MTIDVLDLITEKGGNPEIARESQRKRGESVELVDEVVGMYQAWVKSKFTLERDMRGPAANRSRVSLVEFDLNQLNKQSNALQKEIGAKKKV